MNRANITAAEDATWYSDVSALHQNVWEGLAIRYAKLDFGVCITLNWKVQTRVIYLQIDEIGLSKTFIAKLSQ